MKTLQKIILGASILTSLSGCISKNSQERVFKDTYSDSLIPKLNTRQNWLQTIPKSVYQLQDNQTLFLHPDYLNPSKEQEMSLEGYTILTDLDRDGKWDAAEKVRNGFVKTNYGAAGYRQHTIFFKKGYGPAQSIPDEIDMKYVNSEFFEPYQ